MSRVAASLPTGLRVYAVGDIHGRFDLLEALHAEIGRDLKAAPPRESVEIFLGDYVDRGPQSRDVVEWMIAAPRAADRRVCLMGNHEDMLLHALAAPEGMRHWLVNGGRETLRSYNPTMRRDPADLAQAHADLVGSVPQTHRSFLAALPRLAEFGNYIFVHAGLRPGRPLDLQDADDLVWIREPFLSSAYDFGKVVVHGHTPAGAPEIRPNRINVDTGAVFTGRLTCLVLEADTQRFLQTSST